MHLQFKKIELNRVVMQDKKQGKDFVMTPLELKDYLDFTVKRVYFINPKKASNSGSHCHKKEKEFFIVVKGSCIAVIDYGKGLKEFNLEGPSDALYIGNYVWHHFKSFSSGAILLALSSTNYNSDRSDYIENYKEYKKIIKEILLTNSN